MSHLLLTGPDDEDEPSSLGNEAIPLDNAHSSYTPTIEERTSITEKTIAAKEPITEDIPIAELLRTEREKGNVAANREYFTKLFEQHNSSICTYLAHLTGNDEVGRDLAQDTFIKAWQKLPSLRNPSQPEAWLFRIARNTGIDYLRKQKIRHTLASWTKHRKHEEYEQPKQGFEEDISETECIRQALAQVQEKPRECLILCIIVGLSRQKVAELLELNESSISTYISMGRNQFRKAYDRLKGDEA